MDIENLWDRFSYLFVKHQCVFCEQYPKHNALWCGACSYIRAGRVHTTYVGYYIDAIAAIEYSGNAKDAIWRLKMDGDKRVERLFVDEMHQRIQQYWPDIPFDLVVPIPMNAKQQARRGHNQSILLARRLASQMSLPMEPAALLRHEKMRVQHQLSATERLVNATQSYALCQPEVARGCTILLVDDMITTGATMNICSKLLLEAGAKAVYAIAAQCASSLDTHIPDHYRKAISPT